MSVPAPASYADAVLEAAATPLDPTFIQYHYGAPLPGAFPLAATYQTGMTTALTDTISLQASNGNLASILVLATDSSGAHHLHIVMAPVILDPHRVQAPHPTACIGVTDDAAFTCSTSPSTTELVNDLPL